MTAKIDPQLSDALHSAAATQRPVEAYVAIQPPAAQSGEQVAQHLLGRVEKQSGCHAIRSQYLVLLDCIHISAPPDFLYVLFEQPEVIAAAPPPSVKGSAMIPPVDVRPVGDGQPDADGRGPASRR